jgi:hypothetical protein
MVDCMLKVAKAGVPLSEDERVLLSIAHKNATGPLRQAIKTLKDLESLPEVAIHKPKFREYMAQVTQQLRDVCSRLLDVIDCHLLKSTDEPEARIFYLKLKGDFNRLVKIFSFFFFAIDVLSFQKLPLVLR